ncbi:Uncharacterised protein [uncultured archaeon]|nr:Uncharacterised protein [uncultured archaeon]
MGQPVQKRKMDAEAFRRELDQLLSMLEKGERPDPDMFKYAEKANGRFYFFNASSMPTEQYKELISAAQKSIETNQMRVLFRPTVNGIYVAADYSQDIATQMELNRSTVQSMIDDVIRRNQLTGKGRELYANVPVGIFAVVEDGSIAQRDGRSLVFPAAFGSDATRDTWSPQGTFRTGSEIRHGGWNIPAKRVKALGMSYVPEYSLFNMMGATQDRGGKVQILQEDPAVMMHGRFIYPGTTKELPLGMESGLTSDPRSQTTNACVYIGEGSFLFLKNRAGATVVGNDSDIRGSDVVRAEKNGTLSTSAVPLGYSLPMRNGDAATLMEDSFGNPSWFDSSGKYVNFDRVSFDWDAPGMPQIVFYPPYKGESLVFRDEILLNKRISISYTPYSVSEDGGRLVFNVFPDKGGIIDYGEVAKGIVSEIKDRGITVTPALKKEVQRATGDAKFNPQIITIRIKESGDLQASLNKTDE